MADLTVRDALSRLIEAERRAAAAQTERAEALAALVYASTAPAAATVKGAPDVITMKEACQITRLSRRTLGERTRGMSWRFEHPGKTCFERAPFLRWLDQHRAAPRQ